MMSVNRIICQEFAESLKQKRDCVATRGLMAGLAALVAMTEWLKDIYLKQMPLIEREKLLLLSFQ